VLGSKAVAYYFQKRFNRTEKTFPEIRVAELASLPIPSINSKEEGEKRAHDRIVALVGEMLELPWKQDKEMTPHEQEILQREVAAVEVEIDRLSMTCTGWPRMRLE